MKFPASCGVAASPAACCARRCVRSMSAIRASSTSTSWSRGRGSRGAFIRPERAVVDLAHSHARMVGKLPAICLCQRRECWAQILTRAVGVAGTKFRAVPVGATVGVITPLSTRTVRVGCTCLRGRRSAPCSPAAATARAAMHQEHGEHDQMTSMHGAVLPDYAAPVGRSCDEILPMPSAARKILRRSDRRVRGLGRSPSRPVRLR